MSDEENKTRATTGVKFSTFKQVGPMDGNPVEVVGLRDGENVRASLTTDLIETNPGVTFRNSKGQFAAPDPGVTELTNQLKVNRYLYDRMLERGVTIDVAPPDVYAEGTFWFDNSEDTMQLFLYHEDSDAWIPVAPPITLDDRVAKGEETQRIIINQINAALVEQNHIKDKISALEGAIGEHSFIHSMTADPEIGQFSITNETGPTNTVSSGTKINLTSEDRNGKPVDLDRITVGDVLRLADIGQDSCELQITSVDDSPTFGYNKLGGTADRLSDFPYDFVLLSSFDPAGLATIAYVDERDDTKLSLSGGTVQGELTVEGHSFTLSGASDTSAGQAIVNVKANGPKGKSVIEVRQNGIIKLHNSAGGTLVASGSDEPMTKLAVQYASQWMHAAWQYMGIENEDVYVSDLERGQFCLVYEGSGSGRKVYIYMHREDAHGNRWHGRFNDSAFEHSLDMLSSVTNASGSVRFSMKVVKVQFNIGDTNYAKIHGHFLKEDYYLSRGAYYTINLPGMLPAPIYSSKYNNNESRAVLEDEPVSEMDAYVIDEVDEDEVMP